MDDDTKPKRKPGKQQPEEPTKLGYGFVPVPKRARIARRRGKLSAVEWDVLSELYDRAKYWKLKLRQPTPELTLERLAESIGWKLTESALHKLLCRLRDKGWVSWTIRDRSIYIFTLHPEPSEEIPSSNRPEAEQPTRVTETPPAAASRNGPSSPATVPSSPTAATDAAKPTEAPRPGELVRGAQNAQKNHKPSVKDGVLRAEAKREIPWLPEVREAWEAAKQQRRHENERALLAEAQDLVVAGVATWVEPGCKE